MRHPFPSCRICRKGFALNCSSVDLQTGVIDGHIRGLLLTEKNVDYFPLNPELS
jgi:hypothetical protein